MRAAKIACVSGLHAAISMIVTIALWPRIRERYLEWGPVVIDENDMMRHADKACSLLDALVLSCFLGVVTSILGLILGAIYLRTPNHRINPCSLVAICGSIIFWLCPIAIVCANAVR